MTTRAARTVQRNLSVDRHVEEINEKVIADHQQSWQIVRHFSICLLDRLSSTVPGCSTADFSINEFRLSKALTVASFSPNNLLFPTGRLYFNKHLPAIRTSYQKLARLSVRTRRLPLHNGQATLLFQKVSHPDFRQGFIPLVGSIAKARKKSCQFALRVDIFNPPLMFVCTCEMGRIGILIDPARGLANELEERVSCRIYESDGHATHTGANISGLQNDVKARPCARRLVRK